MYVPCLILTRYNSNYTSFCCINFNEAGVILIKRSTFISTIIIIFIIAILFLLYNKYENTVQVLTKPSLSLPVIMYHNVSKNSKLLGKYTISQKEFEEDLIYLKNQGYTTVGIEDLIAYEYNNINLPENPIMLTFDDGYFNVYRYVLPILKKYDSKAVVSIIGEYVDKSSKSLYSDPYLNWTQINELIDSKYIEIQNHTYSMHTLNNRQGCRIMNDESYEEYKEAILKDIGKFQLLIKEKTGYTPKAFTYPYGFSCKECNKILKDMGFLTTITCNIGINYLYGNSDELYELKRINRPSGINQVSFFAQFKD